MDALRGAAGSGDGYEDRDFARLGISPEAARAWRRWTIPPVDAAAWTVEGIESAADAARWGLAGMTAGSVGAFTAAGISTSHAALCAAFLAGSGVPLTPDLVAPDPWTAYGTYVTSPPSTKRTSYRRLS